VRIRRAEIRLLDRDSADRWPRLRMEAYFRAVARALLRRPAHRRGPFVATDRQLKDCLAMTRRPKRKHK
jgi:hypothetical protein